MAYDPETNKLYAAKIMKGSLSNSTLKVTENEIKMMKQLNHPNIVNLIEFSDNGEYKKSDGTVKKVAIYPLFFKGLE